MRHESPISALLLRASRLSGAFRMAKKSKTRDFENLKDPEGFPALKLSDQGCPTGIGLRMITKPELSSSARGVRRQPRLWAGVPEN
jgi:hypothetical protein